MNKGLILVADDDRLVRVTVATWLRDAGYEVLEAADGEEAVRMAAAESPALAVLDMRMPRLAGLEAAARLRRDTEVPFVLLSAYDTESVVQEAVELGALGYLVKPIDVRQMLPTIEAALDRAAELRSLRESRTQLNTALEQGRETSVAVGILMARHHLAEGEAFDLLRAYARRKRRKLSDVAGDLVRGMDGVNRLAADILVSSRQ